MRHMTTTHEPASILAPETEALLARASAQGGKLVLALLAAKEAERRRMAPRKVSCEIGGWGMTSQIEKEKRGDLMTILAGTSRLTFVPSIYDHLIELAKELDDLIVRIAMIGGDVVTWAVAQRPPDDRDFLLSEQVA